MSGFSTTHVDLVKGIEESCELLYSINDKYSDLASAISTLAYVRKDLTKILVNVNALNPKNEKDREELRKIEETAKATLTKFHETMKAALTKLAAVPDFADITDEMNEAAPKIDEEIHQLRKNVAEVMFTHDVTVDAAQLYKDTYPDMCVSYRELGTLTFESTNDPLLEISINSKGDDRVGNYEPATLIYKHQIQNIIKGGEPIEGFPIVDDGHSFATCRGYHEIIAINGRYLKEFNADQTKILIEREIATGKVILDIVKNTELLMQKRDITFGDKRPMKCEDVLSEAAKRIRI